MPSDWERVDADPALLNEARRRYTGSGDLADQLWWIEHPGTRSPAGAEDPMVSLDSARSALYRPGADASSAADVTRRTLGVTEDRDAARRALRRAEAERPRPVPPAANPAAAPPPPRRLLVGVTLAALLVGGIAGLAVGRFTRTPAPAALAVFDRAQQQDDRPPSTAAMPSFVRTSTIRLLGTSSTTGAYAYGAQATDGRVCLLTIVLAQQSIASCTSETAFAVSGLSLTLEATVDPEDDSGVNRPREITPSWSPTGTLTF